MKLFCRVISGQQVPAGLHYRINLTTGEKEAKLLEDENENHLGDKSSLSVVTGEEESKENNKTKSQSLEEALKNIPADIYEYSQEEMKEIKSKFKTYDEIKEQLKDVNLSVKTDAEIMSKLIQDYEEAAKEDSANNTKEMERILIDLEYLVHQIDNAVDFIGKNGIEKIVIPNLNKTNSGIKVKCLQLLGAMTQNNPRAQILSFERNMGEYLIRFLSTTKIESEISAGFFAFGSLLRRFPLAQKEVLTKSVFNVLFEIWTKDINLKIKVKVLNFLTDLLMESMDSIRDYRESPSEAKTEKYRQYQAVNIENSFKEFNFCGKSEVFFVTNKPLWITNTDQTERVISSLYLTSNLCKDIWSENPDLRHVILVLKNRYSARIQSGEELEDHLKDLISNIDALYNVIFKHLKEKIKDEL